MIRLLLVRFWIIFLPIIIYSLWKWNQRRRAAKAGESIPAFGDGPLRIVWVVTFILLATCFLWEGLTAKPNSGDYVPSHIEADGDVEPGRIAP